MANIELTGKSHPLWLGEYQPKLQDEDKYWGPSHVRKIPEVGDECYLLDLTYELSLWKVTSVKGTFFHARCIDRGKDHIQTVGKGIPVSRFRPKEF